MPTGPRVLHFDVTVDRAGDARSALGGSTLPREVEWWAEHLVLAGLVRCTLASMSSRLFTEVREKRGLGYYVHAGNTAYTDAGTFYASAGVDVARVDEAITTILGELRKIADEPVPADELEKARGYANGRFVLRLESPQGTIQYGLRREVLEGEIEEPDELLQRLDEVTVEDVQRVARELFEDKRLYLALVGPFDDPARFEKLLAA